jgi:hypothetical protein
MKYSDGTDMLVGDKVTVDGARGTVVAVIDTGQYSDAYPKGWSYLKIGALIEADEFGLVHYETADEDLVLIGRAE